jgi:glucose-1-phosphate thymidylyltransferase
VSNIVNDGSTSNETRLGACRDIQFVVEQRGLQQDDLMVIGGDTLFFSDFRLTHVLAVFNEKKTNVVLQSAAQHSR